jgi:hypothetical protein
MLLWGGMGRIEWQGQILIELRNSLVGIGTPLKTHLASKWKIILFPEMLERQLTFHETEI